MRTCESLHRWQTNTDVPLTLYDAEFSPVSLHVLSPETELLSINHADFTAFLFCAFCFINEARSLSPFPRCLLAAFSQVCPFSWPHIDSFKGQSSRSTHVDIVQLEDTSSIIHGTCVCVIKLRPTFCDVKLRREKQVFTERALHAAGFKGSEARSSLSCRETKVRQR